MDRGARRRTEALRAVVDERDLPIEFVDDPQLPHFRLELRAPDYAALALQGRKWMLSAEGRLPFETVEVASARTRPDEVAHALVDSALRIGVDAITADRRLAGTALVEAAFDVAVALGDARRAADSALVLGDAATSSGDLAGAGGWYEMAVDEAERTRDSRLLDQARAKRHAATTRAVVELGRTPELAPEVAPDLGAKHATPLFILPTQEESVPEGFTAVDVPRGIGMADALVAILAAPALEGAEFDGGSGYWPGGIEARTASGIRATVAVFSEFGYRIAVEGPGVERRELGRIPDNTATGDALFSALLGAVIEVETDVASGHATLDGASPEGVARDLDAHVMVLGERATRRTPPSLDPREQLRLSRYATQFAGRPAGAPIRELLARLGGAGSLGR